MARRASGGSSFELVLIAIAAVVMAIVFVVPYALAILLYAFPLFVVWLLVPTRPGVEPRLAIDPAPRPRLAELRAGKRHADEQYDDVRYSDRGVRWSDNLDRFEERSIRGRDLNNRLAYWQDESERLRAEISELEQPEMRAFTQWSNDLRAWHGRHGHNAAKSAAWKLVLLCFVGIWIVFEVVGIAYPGFIRLFAFAWNPAPNLLHPAMAIAAVAAWSVGIYRVTHPPTIFDEHADEKVAAYWNATKIREEEEDRRTTFKPGKDPFEDEDEDDEEQDEEDDEEAEAPHSAWHEVLNVDPHATVEDIKSAYKKAAMACHPDKVAHMNEHIRQVAKEDMQKLNDAFQQARLARGF